MTDRIVHVYRLEVEYPPGSDAPGWVPACWGEMLASVRDRAERRALRRRGFRWPRERMYLSASGAWSRAALLTMFGATVFVDASDPVTWPEWQDTSANGHDWEGGSTAARWEPPEEPVEPPEWEDPLDTAARYLYPAPAEPYKLSAGDVREAMSEIFEGEGGIFR
jgi:hypothetical protein